MKTITFYSYKGGVGRTLLLANVAKYLASFGQKVFALDFDLEAPGLHHKFDLSKKTKTQIEKGIVDYIHSSLLKKQNIERLNPYVLQVDSKKNSKGKILLIPAGNVVSASYWQRLSQINWHELFYSEEAVGVPFFLDLKARIQEEYKPDYLLIDARTGITEIGGVATTILPEYVVCLLLNNQENMEGAREVLRSIKRTTHSRNQESIEIIPVITRLPVKEGSEAEQKILEKVKNFLNEEHADLIDTLSVSDISILHRDRDIELEEAILVESNKSIESTPLLRDYIRLISKIVPKEIIEPNIANLVQQALDCAWEDPEQAERDLNFLAERSARPEPFEALLKFYRLRGASKDKLLRVAWKYWQVTYKADEPLLWEVIKANFDWDEVKGAFGIEPYSTNDNELYIDFDFIFRVWENFQKGGFETSLDIAEASADLKDSTKTIQIIQTIKDEVNISETNIIKLLNVVIKAELFNIGFELINRFKSIYQSSKQFTNIWMKLIIASKDSDRALEFVNSNDINKPFLMEINGKSAVIIYEMVNKIEEIRPYIDLWFKNELLKPSFGRVNNIGKSAIELGFFEEFKNELKKRYPLERASEIIRELERRFL